MGYQFRLILVVITLIYACAPVNAAPGAGIVCPQASSQNSEEAVCGYEGDTCGPGAIAQCCDCLMCVELDTAWVSTFL